MGNAATKCECDAAAKVPGQFEYKNRYKYAGSKDGANDFSDYRNQHDKQMMDLVAKAMQLKNKQEDKTLQNSRTQSSPAFCFKTIMGNYIPARFNTYTDKAESRSSITIDGMYGDAFYFDEQKRYENGKLTKHEKVAKHFNPRHNPQDLTVDPREIPDYPPITYHQNARAEMLTPDVADHGGDQRCTSDHKVKEGHSDNIPVRKGQTVFQSDSKFSSRGLDKATRERMIDSQREVTDQLLRIAMPSVQRMAEQAGDRTTNQ